MIFFIYIKYKLKERFLLTNKLRNFMSSISIKPYASVKGATEYVGAIVTFAVKSGTPGTTFLVKYGQSGSETAVTQVSTLSGDTAKFHVDFGNNIPFKNNSSVQHKTPITIDRTGGVYDSNATDLGLSAGNIFANASGGAVCVPTTQIVLEDNTPTVSGYKMSSSATIYTGIWTTTTFTPKNFFANPSGLSASLLSWDLSYGSSTDISSSHTYSDRFLAENSTTLGDYTLYSVILPVTNAAGPDTILKFEDGSGTLNSAAVSFKLLSTVIQSIKTTCGAPTLATSESRPVDGQYINNNSVTLHNFMTRYIQYNTQTTTYENGDKVSIEPGNVTVVLPTRAMCNTDGSTNNNLNPSYSAGASKCYITTGGTFGSGGTSGTAQIVLKDGSSAPDVSGLRDRIEGTNNTLPYSSSTVATYQIGGTGDYYWYATCIYKSGGVKNLREAGLLTSAATNGNVSGTFSNSVVGGASGLPGVDYDVYCLTATSSSATAFRSPVPAEYKYTAGLEGTIPNISGWINECIYLF